MPKVSVIVPVYNSERTVGRCILSILSQDYKDVELILVNDGSTDESLVICCRYAADDPRVKVLSKKNGGVSSARNFGLAHAVGEWITFVDSDDELAPDYFDGVDTRDEDILFAGYRKYCDDICEHELLPEKAFAGLSLAGVVESYLDDTVIKGAVSKFYKRALLGTLCFPEKMKVGEDACLAFRYIARSRTYGVLPHSVYKVSMATVADVVKYGSSEDYAVCSMAILRDAFDAMARSHHLSRRLFLPYIGYFKRISSGDWKSCPEVWYDDERVKDMYRYVWPDLSSVQKVRLLLARLLKR